MDQGHGCGKEKEIGQILGTISGFDEYLKRADAREERMVRALEDIAEQKGVVAGIQAHIESQDGAVRAAFIQIRTLDEKVNTHVCKDLEEEKTAEKCRPFVMRMWEHAKIGPALLGVLVVGAICDVVFHYDLFKKLIGFFV